MADHQPKIVFFTPTLGRTGSEILLFNLVKQTSFHQGEAFLFIRQKSESTFKVPSQIPHKVIQPLFSKPSRLVRLLNLPFWWWHRYIVFPRFKNSTWVINTISMPEILATAQRLKVRVMLYAHELPHMYNMLSVQDINQLTHNPNLIVANSNLTKQGLIDKGCKVPIQVIYPGLDFSSLHATFNAFSKSSVKQAYGVPFNSFVWLMSGTIDQNKNPLLFVETAALVVQSKPNAFFVWVGKVNDPSLYSKAIALANDLGVTDKIMWVAEQSHKYYKVFCIADGFLLTSSKESFSLVTLEAMAIGLPIVANDCGGVSELLGEGVGTIVSKVNDAPSMSKAILAIMSGEISYSSLKIQQRSQLFSEKAMVDQFINVLLTDLESNPQP